MSRPIFFSTFVLMYGLFFLFRFPLFLPFVYFASGLLIGYYFHVFDRTVQVMTLPELSAQKKQFLTVLQKGKVLSAVLSLLQTVEPISSSLYFIALYLPLAIFMISSTGSLIGTGLILGLGLSYVAHFIWGYKNLSLMREFHFHLLKESVTDRQIKMLMAGFIFMFVVLSVIVFYRG